MDAEAISRRRAEVTALTRAGKSATEIAAILRTTSRTVIRDRVAMGIARQRPERITEDELSVMKQMLDDGASYNEVGATLGRSRQQIARRIPGYTYTRQQCSEIALLARMLYGIKESL